MLISEQGRAVFADAGLADRSESDQRGTHAIQSLREGPTEAAFRVTRAHSVPAKQKDGSCQVQRKRKAILYRDYLTWSNGSSPKNMASPPKCTRTRQIIDPIVRLYQALTHDAPSELDLNNVRQMLGLVGGRRRFIRGGLPNSNSPTAPPLPCSISFPLALG